MSENVDLDGYNRYMLINHLTLADLYHRVDQIMERLDA